MTDEILRRFKARITNRVGLSDASCLIVDAPQNMRLDTAPDQGALISTDGASYNADEDQNLQYLTRREYVDVTLFNRLSAVDESGVARSFTSKAERNLFEFERRVLAALVGWRLDADGAPEIEITEYVKATRRGRVEILRSEDGARFVAFLPLTFQLGYRVDLCFI